MRLNHPSIYAIRADARRIRRELKRDLRICICWGDVMSLISEAVRRGLAQRSAHLDAVQSVPDPCSTLLRAAIAHADGESVGLALAQNTNVRKGHSTRGIEGLATDYAEILAANGRLPFVMGRPDDYEELFVAMTMKGALSVERHGKVVSTFSSACLSSDPFSRDASLPVAWCFGEYRMAVLLARVPDLTPSLLIALDSRALAGDNELRRAITDNPAATPDVWSAQLARPSRFVVSGVLERVMGKRRDADATGEILAEARRLARERFKYALMTECRLARGVSFDSAFRELARRDFELAETAFVISTDSQLAALTRESLVEVLANGSASTRERALLLLADLQ